MSNKVALCEARGPLNSLNDVLAGENGEEWLAALKRFLRKENPWVEPRDTLWQTDYQKAGRTVTLRELLDAAPKAGAAGDRLQRYLDNPETIPAEWKGKYVFFPETEFCDAHDNRCVRFLCWNGGLWDRYGSWVGDAVAAHGFVAVPAS